MREAWTRTSALGVLSVLTLCVRAGASADPPEASPPPAVSDQTVPLCGTHEAWLRDFPDQAASGIAGGCPLQGDCDNPTVRDLYIPFPEMPIKTIRLRIHIFRYDNGDGVTTTFGETALQVAKLNADFAPYRIQFTHTAHLVNDSEYRDFDPNSEESGLKNTYAESPATQLNVYVVEVQCCWSGMGHFPWTPIALRNGGGIIIDQDSWDSTNEVLTHEVGHCLGLFHTHTGVSEVGTCSACYESPPGSNVTGDYCADTPPTPTEVLGNCNGPSSNDPCTGLPWDAQPENFMGYAGPGCWSAFTPQQAGRMHCWITARLQGWLVEPLVPCPAAGSCYEPHGNPGCSDAMCCQAVCAVDAFCCDVQWDQQCTIEATDYCTGCGGVSAGSCAQAHGTPHCNDQLCCEAVCAIDAFCCATQWDGICADEAVGLCYSCGGDATGPCKVAHAGGYCNDTSCCGLVCAADPFCCASQWDGLCVDGALELCAVPVLAGPFTNPSNGNQYFLIDIASYDNASIKAAAMGGHLATVSNAAEREWIRINVANSGSQQREVWLGLSDAASEGTFAWVNGEPLSYAPWAPGAPDNFQEQDYVEMYPTIGTWNDVNVYGGQNNYGVVEIELPFCGDAGTGSCFAAHGSPYCDDGSCCTAVCATDPFCCQAQWDGICVDGAYAACYGCGSPQAGTCFSVHGPGCDDFGCCQSVCVADPFCCQAQWDGICVAEAIDLCGEPVTGDMNSDGVVNAADLSILLGAWGTPGPGDLTGDGLVNAADLSVLLGAWGG